MDNKLKVCFVMFRAYPLFDKSIIETIGGSEVELYKLATYLSGRDDIEVSFIVGDYGQKNIEIINGIRFIKVRYMRLDTYVSLKYKLLRYLYLFRAILRQKSEVYFTKTASELLGWMVLINKYLKGKKVIFRLGSDKDADLEFWKGKGKLYSLYKFGLTHCDKVYVQSKNQRDMLKNGCGIEGTIVKNVFDISEEGFFNKEYILWVSRCEPLKRPELFVELARRLPNEKFLIIMPHANKADSKLDERITEIIKEVKKASGELDNLKYIPSVPFSQIQSYYNRAKLFVNTSEYEGFPNSFIQACIGKTGILSLRVNPDDFITRYNAGLCCNDDFEKAVEFIKGLTKKDISKYGENAFFYVRMNHDITRIGGDYAEDFLKMSFQKDGCGGCADEKA